MVFFSCLHALAILIACGSLANGRRLGHSVINGRAVMSVEITPQTIEDIATAGEMDLQCVKNANPDKGELKVGDTVIVPLACCEGSGSCNAPFCVQRDACAAVLGGGVVPNLVISPTVTGTVTSSLEPVAIVPPPVMTPSPSDDQPPPPPPGDDSPPPPPPGDNPPPPPGDNPPPPPPGDDSPPPPPPSGDNPPPPPPGDNPPPPPPGDNPPPPPPGDDSPPPPPPGDNPPPPPPGDDSPPPPPPGDSPPPPPPGDNPPPPPPGGNKPPPPPPTPSDSCQLPEAGNRRLRSRQDDGTQKLCPEEDEDEDPESAGKPYLISSKSGTSMADFQALLLRAPLTNKKGDMISFDNVPWQSYQILDLSDADAAIVRTDPLIEFVEPITEDDGQFRAIPSYDQRPESHLRKRALPSALSVRENSPYHLGLISARNQRKNPSVLPNYVFQPSLGKGQTIYIIDTGYLPSHEDFDATDRIVRDFTVPNRFTLDPIGDLKTRPGLHAPQDNTDINGHGTAVASVAAGKLRGVASKADLVVVKFRNSAGNPFNPTSGFRPRGVTDAALQSALDFVIGDVTTLKKKNNNDPSKRYVVNLSYGWEFDTTDHKGKRAILERGLRTLWDMDVVVVVCAGNNEGTDFALDQFTPQRLGDATNELITVGGVDLQGVYYDKTIGSRNRGGEVNLYAGAIKVVTAKHNENDDSTTTMDGTSVAAPAVAGLAAYFLGIPELQDKFKVGSVAKDIKAFMIRNSEIRNDKPIPEGVDFGKIIPPAPESIKVPYNLALNDLCDLTESAAKRSIFIERALEESSVGKPVVKDGNVVDEDLKKILCDTTTASPASPGDAPGDETPGQGDPSEESPPPGPPADEDPPTVVPPAAPPVAPAAAPAQSYDVGTFGTKWAIFAHEKGQTVNVCDAGDPLLKGPEVPDNMLGLTDPVTLGPFDLPNSYKQCNFVANDPNAGGDLLCNGQPKVPCTRKKLNSVNSCLGGNGIYQQVWLCNE